MTSTIRQNKIQDGTDPTKLLEINASNEAKVKDTDSLAQLALILADTTAVLAKNTEILAKITDVETNQTDKTQFAKLTDGTNDLSVNIDGSIAVKDPWMEHAKQVIYADYGDTVTLEAKNKDLNKFGRNRAVGTSYETIETSPNANETYLTSNLITSIISTSTSDTTTVVIEGHTISGTDLTFVSQTATLNGRNAVTLTTALARCTRIYASGSVDLVGTISVCETDTYSAGVPDTATGVHCQIYAGKNQSEKASTSISSSDYWVITRWYGDMLTKSNSFAELIIEVRTDGKVFRQNRSGSVSDNHRINVNFVPYLIIPPNSDVRIRAISDTSSGGGRDVSSGLGGSLLTTV